MRRPFAVALAALVIVASCSGSGLVDLDGRPFDPPLADANAVVYLFTRTDCPISNKYAPEVARLYDSFSPRGVEFYLVYADRDDTAPAIRRHLEEFRYRLPALRDPRHVLVRRTGVRVTPEVAVFDRSGTLVYRGRIDDRYVDFGKARPQATVRDLHDTLEAVLGGVDLELRTTSAVGCFISPLE